MKIVITAESTSAIGWAYIMPLIPQNTGRIRITGMKQIPCRQAPKKKPANPFQEQVIMKNIQYRSQTT